MTSNTLLELNGIKDSISQLITKLSAPQECGSLKTAREDRSAEASPGVPIGTIILHAGTVPPAGFLICDGHPVSRTQYRELYRAIGDTWGAGDGINTFNLPDLRGEFIRVLDSGRGIDDGRRLGIHQSCSTALPKLPFTTNDTGNHSHGIEPIGNHIHVVSRNGSHNHTIPQSGSHSHPLPMQLGLHADGFSSVARLDQKPRFDILPTGDGGEHSHPVASAGEHDHSMSDAGGHSHAMQPGGSHRHDVIDGGDKETRPRNQALVALICAT